MLFEDAHSLPPPLLPCREQEPGLIECLADRHQPVGVAIEKVEQLSGGADLDLAGGWCKSDIGFFHGPFGSPLGRSFCFLGIFCRR